MHQAQLGVFFALTLLAECSGCRIAGVGENLVTSRRLTGVQGLEGFDGKEDFTTDLHEVRMTCSFQDPGNARHQQSVIGDIFPGDPITARGRRDQPTLLVTKVQG